MDIRWSLIEIIEMSKADMNGSIEVAKRLIRPWNPDEFSLERLTHDYYPNEDFRFDRLITLPEAEFLFDEETDFLSYHLEFHIGQERHVLPDQPDDTLTSIAIGRIPVMETREDFSVVRYTGGTYQFDNGDAGNLTYMYMETGSRRPRFLGGLRGYTRISSDRPMLYVATDLNYGASKTTGFLVPTGLRQRQYRPIR
ncbi:MAG: hypothetical protein IIC69_02010 [Nanoarchaeota archaeon]|nr:hypothetical protein [Nanoarchaeota archaeon]